MLVKLLLSMLLISSLFSYEVVIDETIIEKVSKSKWGVTFTRDDIKEVVINDLTGLMWVDDASAKSVKKNWKNAKKYCKSLIFSGYDDWYLPTIKELETLSDTTKYNPAIKDAFKNIVSSFYWSSSPRASDSRDAWYVHFKPGNSYYNQNIDKFYVRCVRAGQ